MTATVEEVPVDAVVDLRHRVLRPGRPRHTAHWPGDDAADTRHYRLALDGRTVAIATIMVDPLDPGPEHRLRGMAVEPGLSRQGLGSRLLTAIQTRYEALWCNARAHAVPFYERHGWQTVGEPFEVPEIGPHSRMVWP